MCPDKHLGGGHRFDLAWRYAAFGVASLGLTPLRTSEATTEGGVVPLTFFFMSIFLSALYSNYRTERRLTDLGTEGSAAPHREPKRLLLSFR